MRSTTAALAGGSGANPNSSAPTLLSGTCEARLQMPKPLESYGQWLNSHGSVVAGIKHQPQKGKPQLRSRPGTRQRCVVVAGVRGAGPVERVGSLQFCRAHHLLAVGMKPLEEREGKPLELPQAPECGMQPLGA